MTRTPTCRSCRAPVMWVTMKSGKRNPMNPTPDAVAGNVFVCQTSEEAQMHDTHIGRGVTLTGAGLDAYRRAGYDLYLSHFATCPDRLEHRKS